MRRYTIFVKPGRGNDQVLEATDGTLTVTTTAQPEQGKANARVIRLLAEHFDVAPSLIRIVLGKTAREKLIEVEH